MGIGVIFVAESNFDVHFEKFRHFKVILEQFVKNIEIFVFKR